MGNYPTIGYTFLALSTKWMSAPSRKWRRWISMRYHFIVLYLVWIKNIRGQKNLTPMVETSSADRVAFRILLNVNNRALPRKQTTIWTCWPFPQKIPYFKYGFDWWCYRLDVWVNFKCMKFVAVGWCITMWLRLYQTIRDLTSSDLGIRLLVIWLGVIRLKNTRVVYLLDLFERRG